METNERRYYRILHQVAVAVNSSLDPQAVLETIAQSGAKALDAKACSVMILSPNRRELYHNTAFGLSDWYLRKGPASVDVSMAEALAGRPVVVTNAGRDPRIQYREQAVQEGIASILSVPIRLRDHVVGVLRVYTAEARHFTTKEIEFAEVIANLGAIALENARRYEQLKASHDQVRQDLLEWYATWGLERSADALAGGVSAISEGERAARAWRAAENALDEDRAA